jgi:HEAT repeat protein
LGLAGEAAEQAVPSLIKTLKNDPNLDARIGAADALGGIARKPDLAIPALIKALADPQEGVDYYAAVSLGEFRERATNAIPALLVNFASRDYRNKDSAALALSKISRDVTVKEVIPVLVRDVEGSQNGSGNMSLITLSQMKDEPELVIPAIIGATKDSNEMVRNNAIGMLGAIGPEARAAIPKLRSLTNDPDIQVREQALRVLQNIESSPVPVK